MNDSSHKDKHICTGISIVCLLTVRSAQNHTVYTLYEKYTKEANKYNYNITEIGT